MPTGKFFFIKSKLHGLVLDILDAGRDPGTTVVPFDQKDDGNDNQLWYIDYLNCTIRSKMHDFCLDTDEDNTLIVNPFKEGAENQQYEIAGDRLCQKGNSLQVIDIGEADEEPGARCCVYEYSGDDNQRWEFNYVPANYFYIVSELSGMVIDVWHSETKPGGKCITYARNKEMTENQLWYEDKEGRLRVRQTKFTIDTSKNAKALTMYPVEANNLGQFWIIVGNRIINRFNPSQCAEIKKKSKKKKADIIPAEYKGEPHQHWRYEIFGSNVTSVAAGDDDDGDEEEDSD